MKIEPKNFYLNYEKALAYSRNGEYAVSNKILAKLTKEKPINVHVYHLMGCNYSYLGNVKKANKTFLDGLKQYPNSGILYLELGTIARVQKDFDLAIQYYEKGIEVDPMFPSNYYWLSKIFMNSTEKLWGVMYGEMFLLLEASGHRNNEVSELLFNVYANNINFKSKDTISVSFSKINGVVVDTKDLSVKPPFGLLVYEPTLLMSILGEDGIDLPALARIRKRFIINYFTGEYASRYPNVLFDFQKKILDSQHWDAYNYWLLRQGDISFFQEWLENNKDQFDDFANWYNENGIKLNARKKLLRSQF